MHESEVFVNGAELGKTVLCIFGQTSIDVAVIGLEFVGFNFICILNGDRKGNECRGNVDILEGA